MSIPPKFNIVVAMASIISFNLVTSITADAMASAPNCFLNSSTAPANLSGFKSFNKTTAPSSKNFLAIAFPMPPALPVINAIFPERGLGLCIRCNLASSNNQYSISKAS